MKKILIPKNFNIEEIIEKYPPTFKYKIDEFNYIIEVITHSMDIRKEDGFIPVSSVILQKKIHNYKAYLTYLQEQNIIECDDTFIPGSKSKGYKLTKKYAQVRGMIVQILKPTLIKDDINTPEYLDKWFTDLELDEETVIEVSKKTVGYNISTERSLDRIRNRAYSTSIDSTGLRYHSPITNLKSEYRSALRYKNQHLCSVDIKNSQPYFSTPLFTRQFYDIKSTNSIYKILDKKVVSNFKHNIPYIKDKLLPSDPVNNKKSGEYITNTLLYNNISSSLITDPSFITSFLTLNPNSSLSITPVSNSQSILNVYSSTLHSPFDFYSKDAGSIYMLVNQPEKQYSSDIEHFKELVCSGELYPYIADQLYQQTGVKYDLKCSSEKKVVKEAVFYTLYSEISGYYKEGGEMKKLFASLFPTVFQVFNAIKRNLDKKNGYKVLAILLQRIESNIMIRGVAKELSEKYPELPVFTLHDSIVTLDTEEAKAIVSETIKRHCSEYVGFPPQLSFESWR